MTAETNYRDSELVSLLPEYKFAPTRLASSRPPYLGGEIKATPIQDVYGADKTYTEGVYARRSDLKNIARYQDISGSFKNDFDERQYHIWMKAIEENTAVCDTEDKAVGKGIFVLPEQELVKGTFIPASGIINLTPDEKDFENPHLSALEGEDGHIHGVLDPTRIGGSLDIMNHAFDDDGLNNFEFRDPAVEKRVAKPNLKHVIKYYNGYLISGVEVIETIHGGAHGKELFWSYATPAEYLDERGQLKPGKKIILFDGSKESHGAHLDPSGYRFCYVTVGPPGYGVAFNRWQLMGMEPQKKLRIGRGEDTMSSVYIGEIQRYFKQNPTVHEMWAQALAPVFRRESTALAASTIVTASSRGGSPLHTAGLPNRDSSRVQEPLLSKPSTKSEQRCGCTIL